MSFLGGVLRLQTDRSLVKSLLIKACAMLLLTGLAVADQPSMLSREQRSQLTQVLHHGLDHRGSFISVHAAEALIALHQPELVIETFQSQADTAAARYRIGVWRVLARAQPAKERRNEYVRRIRNVLLDANAPDHLHAMEALAKLDEPIADDAERRIVREASIYAGSGKPFALWRLTQVKNADASGTLVALLRDPDETTRARAAYVLGKLAPLSSSDIESLKRALADEPINSLARPALVVAVGGAEMRQMATNASSPAARYAAAMGLAEQGTSEDQQCLRELTKDPDEDVRVASAFALLKIDLKVRATTAPAR